MWGTAHEGTIIFLKAGYRFNQGVKDKRMVSIPFRILQGELSSLIDGFSKFFLTVQSSAT
jgi:hypothetical protein